MLYLKIVEYSLLLILVRFLATQNFICYVVIKYIKKFEFEGDYNYKTLAASARNQARTMFKPIFRKTAKEVEEIVGAELGRKIWVTRDWDYRDKYISIMSRKADDRIHVYAEIDYEFMENFKETLLTDTRALEKRRDAERKALEK